MLNVIGFLEKMGSDPQWNKISADQMQLALEEADIEGPARAAILNKDVAELQVLMQQKLFNPIIIPGTEEEEEEEQEDGDQPGEKDMRRSYFPSPTSQS